MDAKQAVRDMSSYEVFLSPHTVGTLAEATEKLVDLFTEGPLEDEGEMVSEVAQIVTQIFEAAVEEAVAQVKEEHGR